MNLETFNKTYKHLKDVDKIAVDDLCSHPKHIQQSKVIGKQPARRNILKNGGAEFICRDCYMKHSNPMNKITPNRQTEEVIAVVCPDPRHAGPKERSMKMSCYYGKLQEPYEQICKTCSQLDKVISEEQKEKTSQTMTGRKLSEEHKARIGQAAREPARLEKAVKNLQPWLGWGWNKGLETPDEVKLKISKSNAGKKRTLQQRLNVSKGRKKMLLKTGGFTQEHRQNLSKSTLKQYAEGFDPNNHFLSGWHFSPKLNHKIWFRSSYEKKAYMNLDADETVAHYAVEAVQVQYFNPRKNMECGYLIDLKVTYKNGTQKLVEIKPSSLLKSDTVVAKINAGHVKAKELGATFEVWSEEKLFGTNNYSAVIHFADSIKGETEMNRKVPLYRISQIIEEFEKVIDYELVQHSKKEASLWVLSQHKDKVHIDLIVLKKLDNGSWSENHLHEAEGLFDTTCPIRLLEQAPIEICDGYCESWREQILGMNDI